MFGVFNEGHMKQITYVIDEAVFCDKGANVVTSYMHHYLSKYHMGEKHLALQADNCAGQNENNFLLFYFVWRLLNNLNETISFHFMVAGHTKFAPD